MRKGIIPLALLVFPMALFGQWEASFHQSNIPFAGVGYEIKERFLPELRLNSDIEFEDMALEAVVKYKLLRKDNYALYAGLGLRTTFLEGLVIPLGLDIYPFKQKDFGFHIEMAPIASGEDSALRGSWGIRYRFLQQ